MLSFFTRNVAGDRDFEHIVTGSIAMLADARHSFDLASLAVLAETDVAAVADDVRSTDDRINLAEQELRSELVVHVSVQGGADIGSVLGFNLLLKKIERIGDQAKNILELAEHGVTLADGDDIEAMRAERRTVSEFFAEAGALLADPDTSIDAVDDFGARVGAVTDALRGRIDEYLRSDEPGHQIVPRAIYTRYVLRTAANLVGVVRSASEPITQLDTDADETER